MLTKQEKFNLQAEVSAGSQIAMFMHDEKIQSHFNGLLHGYQNLWVECENPAEREQLWYRANAIKTLFESLQTVVNTGQMAAVQLAADKEQEDQ